MQDRVRLHVEVPGEGYHQRLISCQVACPVHTDARGYVRAIAAGRFEDAYLIARGPNPMASICGRVCGSPCEVVCRRGKVPRVDDDGKFVAQDRPIAIRALKRFVCDQFGPEARPIDDVLRDVRNYVPSASADAEEMAALLRASVAGAFQPAGGQAVAIIGSGPAGLSAAHDLALMGFKPVVFEMDPVAAGMLAVGVPAYRLPRELIAREVAVIEALGVEIRTGVTVGKDTSLAQLRKDYAAVIICVGAKASRKLGLPGENGPGVYGGVDLLRAVALSEGKGDRHLLCEAPEGPFRQKVPVPFSLALDIGHEVVVIGGGNVAYDVARTVLRQIAYDTARTAARLSGTRRVYLVSLETLEEMPADTLEILEGDEEGIVRQNGWGPVAIERDSEGQVTGVVLRRCLRVYDESKRFAPVFDDADRLTLPCDTVLLSVGQSTNLDFLTDGGQDIEQFRPGWPKVEPETLATTAPGVFAAGDLAHGTRLLIDAVASGKTAARSVYRHITGRAISMDATTAHLVLDRYQREPGYESIRRVAVPVNPLQERLAGPGVIVETGYAPAQALREASRCLDCGVTPVFDGTRCVLCGGCVDVCPTQCLKLVALDDMERTADLDAAIAGTLGEAADRGENSAILKDEDRCIRCALCAMRCPTEAITMERVVVGTCWKTEEAVG